MCSRVARISRATFTTVNRVLRRRSVQFAILVELPIVVVGFLAFALSRRAGGDFTWMRDGAQAVLHGHSPYSPPTPDVLVQANKFVYPAFVAYVFVPFALIPHASAVLFLLLNCAAIGLGLRLLGVRDWRCYSVAFLWPATFFALGYGTLGPLLFLGAAAAWRYRDRAAIVSVAAGLAIAAKLFMWPLLIWLVATRRWRAAAGTVGVAVTAAVVGWAGIGFAGFSSYPTTVRVLDQVERWKSYSVVGLARAVGFPYSVGYAVLVACAITGCALVVRLGRRPGGERSAFVVAIFTALFATPLLWNHYLVLLLAPYALTRPRLSRAWAVPLLLWLTPYAEAAAIPWRAALLLAVTAAAAAVTLEAVPTIRLGRLRYRLSEQ
jgi:hypothetical protein